MTLSADRPLEERLATYELLQDLVECSIENANNIAKMNLWEPLLSLIESPEKDLRLSTLRLIAVAARNNPEAAQHLDKHQVVERLLSMLLTNDHQHDIVTIRRILMAISAFCNTVDNRDLMHFMEKRSIDVLESIAKNFESEESLLDQMAFLVLKYSWHHRKLPTHLPKGPFYDRINCLHLQHCNDPECKLSLSHRQ